MIERRYVDVVDLLLDPNNFRHGPTGSQPETRAAIIKEQGKKLLVLANDVIKLGGFSPYDLPLVYPSGGRKDEFIMLEGNRRLLVLKALLDPELVKGTELHDGFRKLSEKHSARLEDRLFCAVVPDRKTALTWAGRKHQRGLGGAGTEDWNAVANERYDAEMGLPTPNLDAMEFVRSNAQLSREVADKIDASAFPITTLGRLLGDEVVKAKLGLGFENGKLQANLDREWVARVLGEMVSVIATGKLDGAKFNVRSIDEATEREQFAEKLLQRFPRPAKQVRPWVVDKSNGSTSSQAERKQPKAKNAKTTGDRETLIPRDFRLKLPEGKVNDIYSDLRTINVHKHPNAIAVEMRVFVELSVTQFMDSNGLALASGVFDSLVNRIQEVVKAIKVAKLMQTEDLGAIQRELASKHSFIAPNTLNAYVHSATYSANPEELKITWNRLAPFLAVLWIGQP